MNRDRPPIHVERMRLRWGEMDAMRHLNNVAYFRYFEEARIAWFESLGFSGDGDGGEGPVLGSISNRFLRPALYPLDVRIELRPGRVGNASFTLTHRMCEDGGAGTVYAEGEAAMVWIDVVTGTSRPIPAAIRAVLQDSASTT